MTVKPGRPGEKNRFSDECGQNDVAGRTWGSAEAVSYKKSEKEDNIRPENVSRNPITGTCGGGIQIDADKKHRDFNNHRSSDVIPQTETEPRPATGIQRHVRNVGDPIENPVREDADPKCEGAGAVARECIINGSEHSCP